MDKNIGRKLDGRYEITELIGIGGMADVYKAIDIIDDRVVAVKILKNEFSQDDEFLRRFRNESKAIAVLSHPNIVKVFDVGFTEKIQFIVMEHIDGITLKEFMEQQSVLKWKDAVHFIIQVLRALQHAHDRGIVHRDIKPQNIMMFPDGTIKVMDFGIARFAREEGKTITDKAIGSVHYISPEQARGDITDEKSDIYSVGIMMYEMLTGQKPFEADNPVSVALMHMQSKARSPREVNNTIPEGLEEIVVRAIQKEATKRYQSASEMIKDIEQFKRDPSTVFEYKYLLKEDSSTRHYETIPNNKEVVAMKKKNHEEYEDDDDEDEEEYESSGGKSMFVSILMAVAAAVLIIAAIFVTIVVLRGIGSDDKQEFNMPNIVGTVYDEVKKKYEGEIKLEIESQEYSPYEQNVVFWQNIPEGRAVKEGTTVRVKISKGVKKIAIPDVYNLEVSVARSQLELEGLKVEIKNKMDEDVIKDYVIKTEPEKNVEVLPDSVVILYVSQGPELQDVVLSSYVGMLIGEVERDLGAKRIVINVEPVNSLEPEGTILGQSLKNGTIVKQDTEILFKVSTGSIPTVTYPLDINIPINASGAFNFKLYVDGKSIAEEDFDNIAYANNKVRINLTGSGSQKVIVEIKSKATGKVAKLAEYQIDFEGKSKEELYYNLYAFRETSANTITTPPDQTTTTTTTTTTRIEGNDDNDGYIGIPGIDY